MTNLLFISLQQIENISTILFSIFGIFGVIYGFYQWKHSKSIHTAQYVLELRSKLFDDKDITDMIYLLDYNLFKYGPLNNKQQMENKMDKLLSVLDEVCYLNNTKLINAEEFDIFKYQVVRCLNNKEIQCYLWNLYHWANAYGKNLPCPFERLIDYGIDNEIIDNDFWNPKSKKFGEQHLNFNIG